MSQSVLSQLLVDVCLDAERLDEVRRDPEAALAAAGVSPGLIELVGKRRGSWISLAVSLARPLPAASEIEQAIADRAAGDPVFAAQLRAEPRPIIDRTLQIRLPQSATVDLVETEHGPQVRISGLDPIDLGSVTTLTPLDQDVDIDVDVDSDVDTDVDVDIDVDIDVDAIVDVDIDIDVDTVVDNVVDTVTVTQGALVNWQRYWSGRHAAWRAADDRFVGSGRP